jgi:hypothetical protein
MITAPRKIEGKGPAPAIPAVDRTMEHAVELLTTHLAKRRIQGVQAVAAWLAQGRETIFGKWIATTGTKIRVD